MQINIGNLKAPCFFKTSQDPAFWWSLIDDFKLNFINYKYAVCIQTGEVRRFYRDQLVTKINLSIQSSEYSTANTCHGHTKV